VKLKILSSFSHQSLSWPQRGWGRQTLVDGHCLVTGINSEEEEEGEEVWEGGRGKE
jgi:hypothetical protein